MLSITVQLLPPRSDKPAIEVCLAQAAVDIVVQRAHPLFKVSLTTDIRGVASACKPFGTRTPITCHCVLLSLQFKRKSAR